MWVWTDSTVKDESVICTFDHRLTTIESFRLLGPDPIELGSGNFVVNAKLHKLSKIRSFACLNCSSPVRVLAKSLSRQLLAFVGRLEIQLYPVEVLASDGKCTDFDVIIPLTARKCADVGKSDIVHWLEEGEVALEYKHVLFLSDCLEGNRVVRDTVTDSFLISDDLQKYMKSWSNRLGLNIIDSDILQSWPFDV